MKRKILLAAIGLSISVASFVAGRAFQHNKSGYHYEVKETKDFSSPVGPVRWSYVSESVGMPFLDPGTTIIEVDGRMIYKAKRAFQQSSPYARNISATQDGIAWDDGEYQFDLRLQKMKSVESSPTD
jgi:hypothetical protein